MDIKSLQKQLADANASIAALKEKRLAASTASVETPDFKSQEKALAAKWGVKSLSGSGQGENRIPGLLQVNTNDVRYRYIPKDEREAVKSLKEAVDVTLMIAQRLGVQPQSTKAYEEMIKPCLKALGINSGEVGYEWIPTAVSESYVDEYNLDRKVAGLFTEIKMPTNPYVYPVLSNGAIARKLGEIAKLSPQDQFASSKITFSAIKMANQYELPEELTEDSAVDVMKVIRMELIEGQEKAMEIGILEGDTAVSHQHTNTQIPGASGAPAADSSERFFDGLRKRALAASLKVDAGASTLNESHLSQARQKLGKFGVNPAELAIIVGPKGYNEMLQLDDVRTLEQYGPQAPVLSGELAKYEGIPVIVSEYLREDTDATGINGATSGNNIRASLLLVNRKRWFTGMRRGVEIRVENYRTQYDVWDAVAYSRRAFEGILKADGSNAASEKTVCLIYNIA